MTDDHLLNSLSEKVALVAGATRGAGRVIAVELARAGAYVAVGVTSGSMRSEHMLNDFEITEQTWHDACTKTPASRSRGHPPTSQRELVMLAQDRDAR